MPQSDEERDEDRTPPEYESLDDPVYLLLYPKLHVRPVQSNNQFDLDVLSDFSTSCANVRPQQLHSSSLDLSFPCDRNGTPRKSSGRVLPEITDGSSSISMASMTV